jgi:hypothetical protein
MIEHSYWQAGVEYMTGRTAKVALELDWTADK